MAKEYISSVSPKGQITLPQEIRNRLGVRPKDKVAIRLEGNEIRVTLAGSQVDTIAGSVPALDSPITWSEATEIAGDEHAQHVIREGLEPNHGG